MTRTDEAEQIFRRLTVENRAALLGCFLRALEAEDSVKNSPDSALQAACNPENAKNRMEWRETPEANCG